MNDSQTISPPRFLARSFAYLIDCGCAFALFVVTQLLILAPLRSAIGIGDEWFHSGTNSQLYTIATISIPTWLYFSLFDCSSWRATIGKRMMSLEVADAASNSRIGFIRSFLRSIIKLLPWELAHIGNNLPTPVWYTEEPHFRIAFAFSGPLLILYIASMYTNPGRRCIHDMIVGTNVARHQAIVE